MGYPTTEELVAEGMAIFRSIVGRSRAGLCAKRIARDRYCQRQTKSDGSVYCVPHDEAAERDHQRLVDAGLYDDLPADRESEHCRCGRRLINPGDADPWCEGCTMSAETCDCSPAAPRSTAQRRPALARAGNGPEPARADHR